MGILHILGDIGIIVGIFCLMLSIVAGIRFVMDVVQDTLGL